MFCAIVGVGAAETEPTISLVKTIVVKEYDGRRLEAEVYQVRRGDYLAKILKKKGLAGSWPIDPRVMELVMGLNPGLGDPNLIRPGQRLFLPVAPPVSGGAPRTSAPAPAVGGEPKPSPAQAEKRSAEAESAMPGFIYHRVRRGERLVKLFRDAGVPDRYIFNEYINLFLRMNPQVRDINLIYAGQEVKIPRWSPGAQVLAPPAAGEQASIGPPSRQEAKTPAAPALTAAPGPQALALAHKTALGLIFTRLGERFIATGQHFLPLPSGGQITLNAATFPLIRLASGHSVILDLEGRLAPQIARLIRANFTGYSIFGARSGEGFGPLMDRLLAECGYYKILRKGEPFFISADLGVRLQADWIIFPTQADFSAARPVVLNLIEGESMATDPGAAQYLEDLGVRVIDFSLKGNLIGPAAPSDAASRPQVEKMDFDTLLGFLKTLLSMLGQDYASDLSIPVIGGQEAAKDFNLSVNAPLYFHHQGVDYLVRFEGVSQDLDRILTAQKAKVLVIDPGAGDLDAVRLILGTLGVEFKNTLSILASKRPDPRNIVISLPGVRVSSTPGPIFFTPVGVPGALTPLLGLDKMRVIRFVVRDER